MSVGAWVGIGLLAFLIVVVIHDVTQKRHAILRNFPVDRPPPLLARGDRPRASPVHRHEQRRGAAVLARSAPLGLFVGEEGEQLLRLRHRQRPRAAPGYIIIRHSAFPIHTPHRRRARLRPDYPLPCIRMLGGYRNRKHAFRPTSIVNTSAMSYGSLSPNAVEAINRGVALAGALQNTGEGGISDYHRKGGDIIWQIGTGYFGCRDRRRQVLDGAVPASRSHRRRCARSRSSCRKARSPGSAACCRPRRSRRRSRGSAASRSDRDCISPAAHTAFTDVSSMLDFIERSPTRPACPSASSPQSAILEFWRDLAQADRSDAGARPTSSRSTAAKAAPARRRSCSPITSRCRSGSASRRSTARSPKPASTSRCVFIGSGKLGFPEAALLALGARLRHDQRRARGDAVDRLHPGAALPHRPLPDRRRDAEQVADARPRSDAEVGAARELPRDAAQGARCNSRTRAASRIRRSCRSISSRSSAVPRARCRRARSIGYEPGWGLPPALEADTIQAA